MGKGKKRREIKSRVGDLVDVDRIKVEKCLQEIIKEEGDNSLDRVLRIAGTIVETLWDGDAHKAEKEYRRNPAFLELCDSPQLAGTTLSKMALQNYLRVSFQNDKIPEESLKWLKLGHRIELLKASLDCRDELAEQIAELAREEVSVPVRRVAEWVAEAKGHNKSVGDPASAMLDRLIALTKKLGKSATFASFQLTDAHVSGLVNIKATIDQLYAALSEEYCEQGARETADLTAGKLRERQSGAVLCLPQPAVDQAAVVGVAHSASEDAEAAAAESAAIASDAEGLAAPEREAEAGEPAEQREGAVFQTIGTVDVNEPVSSGSVASPTATPAPAAKDRLGADCDGADHRVDEPIRPTSKPSAKKITIGARRQVAVAA